MGFRAMEETPMRSSPGPGVGVGRVVTWRGEPFEGRIAARWCVVGVDMVFMVVVGGGL